MMTPREAVEFFRQDASLTYDAIPEAVANSGAFAHVENLYWAFRSRVIAGLHNWRHGFEPPTGDFEAALDYVRESYDVEIENYPRWYFFQYADAAVIQSLVEGTVENELLKQLPGPKDAVEHLSHRHLNIRTMWVLLARSVCDLTVHFEMRLALKTKLSKRLQILNDNLVAYATLIESVAARASSIETALRASEKQFRRRVRSNQFGILLGTGPSNNDVVDFYLAAILRGAEVAGVSVPETVHYWNPEWS